MSHNFDTDVNEVAKLLKESEKGWTKEEFAEKKLTEGKRPKKKKKSLTEAKDDVSTEKMYDKLMGHFKRNKPGRHSGHAGEYFKALQKVNVKNLSSRDESMIKELWSMYGSNLTEATDDLDKKMSEYMEYFAKTSKINSNNLKRHLNKEEDGPLVDLALELNKNYKIGLDGDSIVAPIDGGEISIRTYSKGGFWVAYDNYKTQKGYGWDKTHDEIIKIFKKEGLKESVDNGDEELASLSESSYLSENDKVLVENLVLRDILSEGVSTRVLKQYIETALWSSTDDDGGNLDDDHDYNDVDKSVINQAKKDLDKFFKQAGDLLDGEDETTVAHDFWLTRNGHGAGFWDGDYEEEKGKALSKLAEKFGEVYLYIGDDGKIYS